MAVQKKAAATERAPRKRTPRVTPVAAPIPVDDEVVIPPVVEGTKPKYWLIAILVAAGLVLATVLLWPDPEPQPKVDEKAYQERIRLLEEAAQGRQAAASTDSQLRELRKELAEAEFKKVTNINYYTKSDEKLKKVRSDNATLHIDSLRRKVAALTGIK